MNISLNQFISRSKLSGIASLMAFPALLYAQDFKGQWKGEFADLSTGFSNWGGEKCEYVLELESSKKSVSGFSYTYFTQGGKKFYTICKVEGSYDKQQKFLKITETERVKTNIPDEIKNCFQVHKLTYFKKGNEETLQGDWVPAPNQQGDCGFGKTSLSRRILDNSFISRNKSKTEVKAGNKTTPAPATAKKHSGKPATQEIKTNTNQRTNITAVEKEPAAASKEPTQPSSPTAEKHVTESYKRYEKRANTIIKSIEVTQPRIKVELFDNGEIDGDSVSIFLNQKLLVSQQRLTAKPITLQIDFDPDQEESELEMYAENLGTIAPNTAVMIVTDGNKRYEVRVTSDLKKSGVVRLTRKKAS